MGQDPVALLDEWQRQLLPLMMLVLVAAALFFAWLSVSESSST